MAELLIGIIPSICNLHRGRAAESHVVLAAVELATEDRRRGAVRPDLQIKPLAVRMRPRPGVLDSLRYAYP